MSASASGDADKAAVDEVLAGIKNDLTLRLAEEACQRVFTGDVVAAGVDFILNCPLGESPTTVDSASSNDDK